MNCKPYCHITTGFSGAGAFSDGKLSLSPEVGGDLPQLIGEDTVQSLIEYTDSIYLEFGADTRVEGVSEKEAVKRNSQACHPDRSEACRLPHPSPRYREGAGDLLRD